MELEDLNVIVSQINKKYGRAVITPGGGYTPRRISTGSLGLDLAIGGGWPMGRFVVLWGNRSSTKSTLSLWTIANAQKDGLKCLYIDSEKTFDSDWAEANGVNVNDLMVTRLSSLEEILDTTKPLLKEGLVDVIVVDSINGVNTVKYFEDNNGSLGLHARTMAELLNKWSSWNNDSLIMLISQSRTKMQSNYAYTEYTGGLAMDYWPSVIVKLFSSRDPDTLVWNQQMNGNRIVKTVIAQKIRWEITKSKISPPHQDGSYTFLKAGGLDVLDEIVDLGVRHAVIPKAGAWYYIGEEKFHGADAVKQYLIQHRDMVEEVRNGILEAAHR